MPPLDQKDAAAAAQALSGAAQGSDLVASLEADLPEPLIVGRGLSVLVHGWCFHPHSRIRDLELVLGDAARPVTAHSIPRVDVYRAHPGSGELSYRSGFWGMVDIERRRAPELLDLEVRATLEDGRVVTRALAPVHLKPTFPEHDLTHQWATRMPAGYPSVGIVMPTYNPDPALFRTQVETIRAQSHGAWACLVCDDQSDPAIFEQVEAIVAEDPRFLLHRFEERAGFYRNYERGLAMMPPHFNLVALADQDDRWHPDKLATLIGALGEEYILAYSNKRVVEYRDGEYEAVAGTYWEAVGRRNQYRNLAPYLLVNSVTGAAAIFRRRLLSYLLPMPQCPGPNLHDHWLAVMALCCGDIAFVKASLTDWVVHDRNATSGIDITWRPSWQRDQGSGIERGRRGRKQRWRTFYVKEVLHLVVYARTAMLRCGNFVRPSRRRALVRAAGTERGLRGLLWLLRRWLVPKPLRSSTEGVESLLMRGLMWRWTASRSRAPDTEQRELVGGPLET